MKSLIGLLSISLMLSACQAPTTPDAGSDARIDALPDVPADTARPVCTTDHDCDDTVFCDGAERCMPGASAADRYGCVRAASGPCMSTQHCNETQQRCETVCAVEADADHDGHRALACGGDDCDDNDAQRFPGNPEVCDPREHDEDCDATTFGTTDVDHDTFVDARCCNVANDGTRHCGEDCNDQVRAIHPLATEVCDHVDNNCNGMTDEGVTLAGFADADHDLHGDPMHAMSACPGAVGFSGLGDDCDDHNAAVNPTQVEICDGIDNNCNGMTDEGARAVTWYLDADGDGFGAASSGTMVSCAPVPGATLLANDCDDTHRNVSPGAVEQCDGIDNDCNGLADFILGPDNLEDDDGDLAPDIGCPRLGTDCDDRDANTHPRATELCDGRDNDCNGVIDDGTGMAGFYPDADGDGYGDAHGTATSACMVVEGRATRAGDCDDTNPHVHPGVDDPCDGIDNDCDGMVDEDAARTAYYVDADHDGYGTGMPTFACAPPAGFVALPGDCDDTRATAHPGATEICNGLDDDCDGMADNGAMQVFHTDADGDHYGVAGGPTMVACVAPAGWAPNATDCDDTRATVHPGAPELCDRLDNDCDGTVDNEPAVDMACAAANATAVCSAGACTITHCATGFLDCDGNAVNGCEAAANSTANCGGCGATCARNNAVVSCAIGTCDYTACVSGFGDCDATRTNGCETRLSTASNCGACGMACPAGGSCVGGTCVCPGSVPLVCPAASGTGSVCADGATDAQNCGTCGTHCPAGCGSGACLVPTVSGIVGQSMGALMSDGTTRAWGLDDNFQLGFGNAVSAAAPTRTFVTGAQSFSIGRTHGCAVLSGGTVECWGHNDVGELGQGTISATPSATAVLIPGITDAVEVVCGGTHSCLRRAGGQVMCWGGGVYGQIGDGARVNRPSPVALSLTNVTHLVSNGTDDTCAIHADGHADCWGYNYNSEAGIYAGGVIPSPVTLGVPNIAQISIGNDHACAVTTAGVVYCWGACSSAGALGDNCTSSHGPLPATVFNGMAGLTATSTWVGSGFTCVSYSNGTVQCVGRNNFGQLGNGTTTWAAAVSVPAFGLTNAAYLTGTDVSVCAVDRDGTTRCWGSDSNGQLGDGGGAAQLRPTLVIW